MSIKEQNVAIIRKAYERWHESKGGSTDHWLDIMADQVDFRSLADGADGLEFTKHRHSREEVVGYLQGLVDTFEMIHYTVDEYIAQGDRVVAVGSTAWRDRKTGKIFDTPKVDLWRLEGGRIVQFFEFYDTAKVQAVTVG